MGFLLRTALKHPLITAAGGAAVGGATFAGMWAYGLGHAVRPDEKAKELPGDDLIDAGAPKLRLEAAITIDAPREQIWPFIAQIGQRRVGFVVDQLVGQQDIVIKALGPSQRGLPGFAGATDLGDQQVALVLDAAALMEEVLGVTSGRAERLGAVS